MKCFILCFLTFCSKVNGDHIIGDLDTKQMPTGLSSLVLHAPSGEMSSFIGNRYFEAPWMEKLLSSDPTQLNFGENKNGENVTRESVPEGTYAVFDRHGQICILITLSVEFDLMYFTEYEEKKNVIVALPKDAVASGSCARDGRKPKIIFTWGNFKFAILFSQNEYGNTWFVDDMVLIYNMRDKVFVESRAENKVLSARLDAELKHILKLFATPIDKAYYCTSEQDLLLLDSAGGQVATIILRDVHIQPYVKDGQFGPSVNCPGGKVTRRKINENVPLAVGSIFTCVTLATIAGYALWRHIKVKKFNYGTME